jgi:hypothetical protein
MRVKFNKATDDLDAIASDQIQAKQKDADGQQQSQGVNLPEKHATTPAVDFEQRLRSERFRKRCGRRR